MSIHKTMITIFVKDCNQISQSFYDSVVFDLPFHQLTCSCSHSACLQSLTREDLIRIMVEPKNALTKQYQQLLQMDGVELEITDDALGAIAQKALDRQIGARGLRAIMEKIMTGIMYEIPSDLTIQKVIVTPACVDGSEPTIVRDPAHPREKA